MILFSRKVLSNKIFLITSRSDCRLSFSNLRDGGKVENIIGSEERDAIWIPNLYFDNSVEETYIYNDLLSSLSIYQNGSGVQRIDQYLQENIWHNGSENNLIFLRTYKMDLVCEFDLHNYPFDRQTCSVQVLKKVITKSLVK